MAERSLDLGLDMLQQNAGQPRIVVLPHRFDVGD